MTSQSGQIETRLKRAEQRVIVLGAAVLYYKNEGSLRFYDADGAVMREFSSTSPD